MVVVEDLHDLGLVDAGDALGLLGVVDEDDPARDRAHEVGAGDEPDRTPGAVDGDGRAVVDVLDELGDVRDEVVGPDRQRIAVHEGAAGRRQRDHAAGDVAVQRRQDDGGAVVAGQGEDGLRRGDAVAGDEQVDPGLDDAALGVVAVADDDDVAAADAARVPVGLHGVDPHPAGDPAVLPHDELAAERVDDGADRRGGVDEARRLAGLADVAPRERALGHHPGQRALVVDDRDEVEALARHGAADLAHRLLAAPARLKSPCITSQARRNTWGRRSGSVAPERSSAHRVCALTSPSRTGTYSSAGRRRRSSSAYPMAEAIESVSGFRWPVT